MARTNISALDVHVAGSNRGAQDAVKAKLDEHDTALDQVFALKTVTVDEAALTGAEQVVNIGTALPTGAIVLAHDIVVNEQGAGQSDLTIKIGGTDDDAIVASTDLDALAEGTFQGTLGVRPRGSYSAQQLTATFAATNLATLSAGNWTFNVWYGVINTP